MSQVSTYGMAKALGIAALCIGIISCSNSKEIARSNSAAQDQLTILESLAPVDAPVEASLPLSMASIRNNLSEPDIWVTGRGKVPENAAERPVRVASISKLAVAIVAMALVEEDVLGLDQDISGILGWPLRHPAHPDTPITVRQLLSHQSSLSDGAEYQAALPATLQDLMRDERFYELPHEPGTYFKYANINYGVLGTVMEAATGKRFDRLMQERLFEPAGLDAGFNWHGVSLARQAQAIPAGRFGTAPAEGAEETLGPAPGIVIIAVDGEPVGPSPTRRALDSYIPGTNATVFSPQGGMRASLTDLIALGELFIRDGKIDDARILKSSTVKAMMKPQWRLNSAGDNGDSYGGLMTAFGLGVQVYEPGDACFPTEAKRYVGHFGEAYGLLGGLLVDPKADKTVTYLFPYTPDTANAQISECSGLYFWEERFLKVALGEEE